MDKESKITAISHVYSAEEVVPKSVFDGVLDRYERSLVHLGQSKEQNRYMLEVKNQAENLKKELEKRDDLISKKEQNIADLEMYIKILEEENKESKKNKNLQTANNGPEKNNEDPLQFLDTNELEALEDVFDVAKSK